VILIEPLYDCYLPLVERAGGVPKFVRIEPPDWALSEEALRAAFSEKTKLILLNTPHNPAAKVFGPDELETIAALVREFDAYVVCDEVYEHILFDGRSHVPLMTLDGMRERTVRIGSAGKTFSMTAWKVGYVTAPPNLIGPISKAHQFVTFTTPRNLQSAVAMGLTQDDAYFESLSGDLEKKRDRIAEGLADIGFEIMATEGTYFLSVDIRSIGFEGTDVEFCEHITRDAGVTAIPLGAFYPTGGPDHFVRFCFSKQDAVLDAALGKLRDHFKGGSA